MLPSFHSKLKPHQALHQPPLSAIPETKLHLKGLSQVQDDVVKDLWFNTSFLLLHGPTHRGEGSLQGHSSVFSDFACLALGSRWLPVCVVLEWLQSRRPLLQSCAPLKPPTVAAREDRLCATDVFTVRFQTAAFPFFRLFFLYLSNPLGQLAAHSPGSGFLCESPHTRPRMEQEAAPAAPVGLQLHRLQPSHMGRGWTRLLHNGGDPGTHILVSYIPQFWCLNAFRSPHLSSWRAHVHPLPWRIPGYFPVHRNLCGFGTKSQVAGSGKNESKPWSPIWPAVKNVTAVATQALAQERDFFPFIYSFSWQISVDSLRGEKNKESRDESFLHPLFIQFVCSSTCS